MMLKQHFFITLQAQRDGNDRPGIERKEKMHFWLRLAAGYVLVNTNAKFQKTI